MTIYFNNWLFIPTATQLAEETNGNNPVIGYHSVLRPQDIEVTSTTSVRPAVNMWSPDTSAAWEGESYSGVSATLTQNVDLLNPENRSVDYVAIAKHNFGTSALTYSIEVSTDGVAYTEIVAPKLPGNNNAILEMFEARNEGFFRVKITKTSTEIDAPIISHVKLGLVLVLQRRIFVGHAPATISKSVRKQNQASETGQFLGEVVLRSFHKGECSQQNNTADYVREKIAPFISHVNGEVAIEDTATTTFFFAWRPEKYPNEVIYAWTGDDIKPSNQGGYGTSDGLMSWSFSMEGVA